MTPNAEAIDISYELDNRKDSNLYQNMGFEQNIDQENFESSIKKAKQIRYKINDKPDEFVADFNSDEEMDLTFKEYQVKVASNKNKNTGFLQNTLGTLSQTQNNTNFSDTKGDTIVSSKNNSTLVITKAFNS